jgi:2-dehydropantoate 2-reductase
MQGRGTKANGYPPRPVFLERARATLTTTGSAVTASMLRDMARDAPIEADHIIGDTIRRRAHADAPANCPLLLEVAYVNLKAYDARHRRALAGRN